jgi:probable O-glycosylation ligase (exosortase A-associated)
MRDFIVLAIIFGSVPICFINPYFGVLMWSWIAYFNPHRFTWGIAYHFPVAWVVALPTLAGLFFTPQKNRGLVTRETVLLFSLGIWFWIVTLYASQQPIFADHIFAFGLAQLSRITKILLMTFVTILLVNSKEKLKYLCLVIACSIGAVALKGAIFGARTEGLSRVYGPPDSFIADNNAFALAMNMTLPILYFMARETQNRILRFVLRVFFVSGIIAVILSYSRGGLVGLAVVLGLIAMRSRYKLAAVAILLILAFLVISFAPPAWMARMGNFVHGNLDNSAEKRLNAWHFAWVLALHYPLTGGGFETFTPELFQQFTPGLEFAGPHSIYFQLLGEQGFVGLGLYLSLLACSWLTLRKIRKGAKYVPSCQWMVSYTYMLEVSFLGYMVSGAFLPLGYFDYYYQLVAIIVLLKIFYRREVAQTAVSAEEQPVATMTVATAS